MHVLPLNREIDTFLLDMSEVSFTGLKASHDALCLLLGIDRATIYEAYVRHGLFEFFRKELTEDEYLARLITAERWPITLVDLKRFIRSHFKPIEGTERIIRSLRKRGFKLGLLSDHAVEWVDHFVVNYNHHDLYHEVIYSFHAGACKPEEKAFQFALNKLDAKAERTLFIDDRPDNIRAARRMGMSTIQFTDPDALVQQLGIYGIHL